MRAWEELYPWASLGILYDSGKSIGENDNTYLTLVPFSFGLKCFAPKGWVKPYLGIGMTVTYAHIKNSSPFVEKHQSHWGVGGVFKGGSLFYVTDNFFIDILIDYTYLKINFHDHPNNVINSVANLSGFSFGGGFGCRF